MNEAKHSPPSPKAVRSMPPSKKSPFCGIEQGPLLHAAPPFCVYGQFTVIAPPFTIPLPALVPPVGTAVILQRLPFGNALLSLLGSIKPGGRHCVAAWLPTHLKTWIVLVPPPFVKALIMKMSPME